MIRALWHFSDIDISPPGPRCHADSPNCTLTYLLRPATVEESTAHSTAQPSRSLPAGGPTGPLTHALGNDAMEAAHHPSFLTKSNETAFSPSPQVPNIRQGTQFFHGELEPPQFMSPGLGCSSAGGLPNVPWVEPSTGTLVPQPHPEGPGRWPAGTRWAALHTRELRPCRDSLPGSNTSILVWTSTQLSPKSPPRVWRKIPHPPLEALISPDAEISAPTHPESEPHLAGSSGQRLPRCSAPAARRTSRDVHTGPLFM